MLIGVKYSDPNGGKLAACQPKHIGATLYLQYAQQLLNVHELLLTLLQILQQERVSRWRKFNH
jgi:hypothetical protein